MKYLLILLAVFVFVACNSRTEQIRIEAIDGKDGTSCSVAPEVDEELETIIGSRISCTDGSFSVVLNGQQGIQGVQGIQGIQGPVGAAAQSCQAYRSILFSGVWLACPNQLPVLIKDGQDGEDGKSCSVKQLSNGARITCGSSVAYIYDGQDGKDGKDGKSCALAPVSNGVKITCGNTSQTVLNGTNGTNGQPGAVGPQGEVGPVGPQGPQGEPGENALANAIGIAGYIFPCGSEFDNDEVLLRLTDGNILAVYDGGPHEDRLVLVAPGNYITTDRNKNKTCHFTVTQDLQITNEQVK